MIHNETYYKSFYAIGEETTLASILLLIMSFALYGNTCLLIVLYKNDRMWTCINLLIGNLALSGLFVTIFSMPFHMISVVLGRWPFKEGSLCQLNAFLNSMLLLVTIFTHTMIGVDKFFKVVKPLNRFLTVTKTKVIIFLVWLLPFLFSSGPLFKIGAYAYNPSTLICGVRFPEKKLDRIYLIALAFIGFILPVLIMIYSYIRVFIAVRVHKRRLRANSVAGSDVMKLQGRLIGTAVLSVLCFIISWAPFASLVLLALKIKSPSELPHGLGVAVYWCGYSYSAVNPFIICFNKKFGDGMVKITWTWINCPFKNWGKLKCIKFNVKKKKPSQSAMSYETCVKNVESENNGSDSNSSAENIKIVNSGYLMASSSSSL